MANPGNIHIVNASGIYYFISLSAAGCWGPEGSYTVVITPIPPAPAGDAIQYSAKDTASAI